VRHGMRTAGGIPAPQRARQLIQPRSPSPF
jgi:hypothetical protein